MFDARCRVESAGKAQKDQADEQHCLHDEAHKFACPSSAASEEGGALAADANNDLLLSTVEADGGVAAKLLSEVEESMLEYLEHAQLGGSLIDDAYDRHSFGSCCHARVNFLGHAHHRVDGGRADLLLTHDADDLEVSVSGKDGLQEPQMCLKETRDADDAEFSLGDNRTWAEAQMFLEELCEEIGISRCAQVQAQATGCLA
eukprot:TRINITY_DN34755_c0_g1_i1.p1 TRINITY_DN34755_c0_g1~~TRINITY_DN34755_c0_g1_i1.p1  ORF type:complete len:224 (-),score=42.04 TRINITY_DN34755_c0_g1_i1:237-842(-)